MADIEGKLVGRVSANICREAHGRRCWQPYGGRGLCRKAVVLAGARSFDDPSEVARLKTSNIRVLTCEELRTPGKLVAEVRHLSPTITGLYVHINLDVLDQAVAGVNVFGAPEGLDSAELDGLLAALTTTFPVRAVTMSAYEPAFDKEDRLPPIALRLLRTIASTF